MLATLHCSYMITLSLSNREERVIAKTLCVLATNEPGDNWVFNTFRWMRSMDSMPGWELVRSYLKLCVVCAVCIAVHVHTMSIWGVLRAAIMIMWRKW